MAYEIEQWMPAMQGGTSSVEVIDGCRGASWALMAAGAALAKYDDCAVYNTGENDALELWAIGNRVELRGSLIAAWLDAVAIAHSRGSNVWAGDEYTQRDGTRVLAVDEKEFRLAVCHYAGKMAIDSIGKLTASLKDLRQSRADAGVTGDE